MREFTRIRSVTSVQLWTNYTYNKQINVVVLMYHFMESKDLKLV